MFPLDRTEYETKARAINADNNQIINFLNWKQWKEFYAPWNVLVTLTPDQGDDKGPKSLPLGRWHLSLTSATISQFHLAAMSPSLLNLRFFKNALKQWLKQALRWARLIIKWVNIYFIRGKIIKIDAIRRLWAMAIKKWQDIKQMPRNGSEYSAYMHLL